MDPSLHLAAGLRMSALIALSGRDLVAALVAGGFHVARRERGLALLVRGVQVVVVPETGILTDVRIRGLLTRAEVSEEDLLTWLAMTGATPRASSGFHKKTLSEPPATIHDAVKNSSDARARAGAAHVATRHALASSDAVQESLAKWRDAVRELDEREQRELRTPKR